MSSSSKTPAYRLRDLPVASSHLHQGTNKDVLHEVEIVDSIRATEPRVVEGGALTCDAAVLEGWGLSWDAPWSLLGSLGRHLSAVAVDSDEIELGIHLHEWPWWTLLVDYLVVFAVALLLLVVMCSQEASGCTLVVESLVPLS